MLVVLIILTPGRRNEFIDCQKAKVCIAVLPIMDVKTCWNSTPELVERAYRLREFIREWLQNLQYSEYRPQFTTQDEWSIAKYVMQLFRPFRYWTFGCPRGIQLHFITFSQYKVTCSITWMAYCELWPRRRLSGTKTCSSR